jgi:N-alpha-acetyltransferase 15/16, NatA auxiliary subunit
MKALIIGTQGQTESAFALAKVALGNNMKSHVCWHVYGLLYRSEKNFEESIKAYKFALRLEPESVPIQRDLAHLQIQMRDYEGYAQSRQSMLQQKPGIRQNWTALAIAHHLGGNYEQAENVLTTYEDTLKTKPARSDMEHWEAVLYKNTIIAESGQTEKALDHLEAMGKKSPDILGVMELRASYLLKLGRKSEAEAAYSALLDRNPENSVYYDGYIQSKGLKDDEVAELKKAYAELSEKFPKSDLPRRRPLDFLEKDEFREAVDAYLQRMFRKGVPSTFANIKHLYTNSSKKDIVQDVVEGFAAGKVSAQPNGDVDKKDHFESSVLYFLAQHYNYKLSRDLDKAMTYADKCIALESKSVDFHAVKARTYKHQGNLSAAAKTMDAARALDEKDRAINTKCAKYQLRNDETDAALETASKFTQNKTAGGPLGDLLDMQCVWYLTEDGQSYLRQRKLGLALKRFHQILAIFDVWQDDQFDFHNFSLRKGMIRAYVDMLRWEDHLRDHPYFAPAAVSACKAYVLLHDNPDLVHGPLMASNTNEDGSEMSAADRKKQLKKAKREQEKMEKAEADKRAAAKAAKPTPKSEMEDGKKEDTDPLGKTLLETKDPLGQAMRFLGPLLEAQPECVEAQAIGFEVFRRRSKVVGAARCLKRLSELTPEDQRLPGMKAQMGKLLKKEGGNDRAVEIVRGELKGLGI